MWLCSSPKAFWSSVEWKNCFAFLVFDSLFLHFSKAVTFLYITELLLTHFLFGNCYDSRLFSVKELLIQFVSSLYFCSQLFPAIHNSFLPYWITSYLLQIFVPTHHDLFNANWIFQNASSSHSNRISSTNMIKNILLLHHVSSSGLGMRASGDLTWYSLTGWWITWHHFWVPFSNHFTQVLSGPCCFVFLTRVLDDVASEALLKSRFYYLFLRCYYSLLLIVSSKALQLICLVVCSSILPDTK